MSTHAPQFERRPYFLYGALAVPALWIAYFGAAILLGLIFGSRSSADLGNWGQALIVFLCLLVASEVIGLVCSIASVIRRERFRGLGFTCLAIYSIPALCFGFLAILQLGAGKGQRAMNETAATEHSVRQL